MLSDILWSFRQAFGFYFFLSKDGGELNYETSSFKAAVSPLNLNLKATDWTVTTITKRNLNEAFLFK